MANASHGSAPDIAGKNCANPVSMAVSAAMLLGWLGLKYGRDDLAQAERAILDTVAFVLAEPKLRTIDVGGSATTRQCTRAIVDRLGRGD